MSVVEDTTVNKFITLMILLFFGLWLIFLLTGLQLVTVVQFIVSLVILFFVLNKGNVERKSFIFISIFTVIFVLSNLFSRNFNITGTLFNLQYIFVALGLVNFRLNNQFVKFSFIIHTVIFGLYMLLGFDPNTIFVDASRNTISVVMLIQSALFYISVRQHNDNILLYPALLTVIISLWGIGRSGIASSVIVLLGVLGTINIRKFFTDKMRIWQFIVVFVGIFGIAFVVSSEFADSIEYFIQYGLSRFEELGFVESTRASILQDFFKNIDSFKNFMFGPDLSEIIMLNFTNNNLHNSYLRLYAYFGIFGVTLIILYSLKTFVFNIMRSNYLEICLLVAILIRISTDSVAFPGPLDPVIIYLLTAHKERDLIHAN